MICCRGVIEAESGMIVAVVVLCRAKISGVAGNYGMAESIGAPEMGVSLARRAASGMAPK